MTNIRASDIINGVKVVQLKEFADQRGRFMETFRTEWFPERSWSVVQTNRSDSDAGVLRGLHFHKRQVDYWHVAQGSIRVALADLRQSSATFGATEVVDINQDSALGLYIPVGVAHGLLALTRATLIYVVDSFYDGNDEFGIAWNDPDLDIKWGTRNPVISPRDRDNPQLASMPQDELPE